MKGGGGGLLTKTISFFIFIGLWFIRALQCYSHTGYELTEGGYNKLSNQRGGKNA